LFTGRDDELAALDEALESGTTVVISALAGAGGIGKTWLALQWAHRHLDRFPDGQLFVDLRGFSPDGDPMPTATALRGFLDALGVDAAQVPMEVHAQSAMLRSLVMDKRMLVVLDNAADTAQVAPLLPGSSTCTVLVTSRNHLAGLVTRHGAQHLSVDVISDAEARALLAARVGADRVEAEAGAVAELLARCGGFPLALSIVAGRAQMLPGLSLADLAAELRGAGLGALDEDDPTASLPTVLSWSYHALTKEQARVFALLGIAPGPDIGLSAAASLSDLPLAQAGAVLRGLVQASLITQDNRGRYRMHDLIRRYAADHAAGDLSEIERETALRRLVDFYLHTSHIGHWHLHPVHAPFELDPPAPGCCPEPLADAVAAMAWFDAEHACLLATQQAAGDQGWYRDVLQLAWGMITFHRRHALLDDYRAVWQASLTAATTASAAAEQAVSHRQLGHACARAGRHDEALDHLRQALAISERIGDLLNQGHTHQNLAVAWAQRGDDRQALDHVTQALQLFRTLSDPVAEAAALSNVGWYSARLGEYSSAREHCEAALALHRGHNDREAEAITLDSLGYIANRAGEHVNAVERYQEALALLRELGHTYEIANTLDNLGHPHAALGDHGQARAVWREALELYRAQNRDAEADRVQRQIDGLS
jgi:tetratricopeptide (TPR) repeat protein